MNRIPSHLFSFLLVLLAHTAQGQAALLVLIFSDKAATENFHFTMGTDDPIGRPEERPAHRVRVHGYWMDSTEVTNRQWSAFVDATHYVSDAERAPTVEEILANSAPGTAARSQHHGAWFSGVHSS